MKALVILTAHQIVEIEDIIPNNPDGPISEQEAMELYKDSITPNEFINNLGEENSFNITILKVS